MAEATDVVLVGGIMSATLGVLLKELEPSWEITLIERLEDVALESSNAWNNSKHGAFRCANWTMRRWVQMGLSIQRRPQYCRTVSCQPPVFGATLVARERDWKTIRYINAVPHMSLAVNGSHCSYLENVMTRLKPKNFLKIWNFPPIGTKISGQAPLMMRSRDENQPVAANFSAEGSTDVDFGRLTRQMVKYLQGKGVKTEFNRHVEDIKRESDGAWVLKTADTPQPRRAAHPRTRFLFLGAGGGGSDPAAKSASQKAKATAASPCPACSSATAPLKPPNNTTPKCTGRLPSARRRCPSRTSTHATWTANATLCSAHMQASVPTSSSKARLWICRCPSIWTTYPAVRRLGEYAADQIPAGRIA